MIRYRVTFTPRDLAGFLDMLRYDRATVESWDHTTPPAPAASSTLGPGRGETWTVELSSERPPTAARWSSFGLYPQEVRR